MPHLGTLPGAPLVDGGASRNAPWERPSGASNKRPFMAAHRSLRSAAIQLVLVLLVPQLCCPFLCTALSLPLPKGGTAASPMPPLPGERCAARPPWEAPPRAPAFLSAGRVLPHLLSSSRAPRGEGALRTSLRSSVFAETEGIQTEPPECLTAAVSALARKELTPLFPELQVAPEASYLRAEGGRGFRVRLSECGYVELVAFGRVVEARDSRVWDCVWCWLQLNPLFAEALAKRGIEYMTDIQLRSFDPILSGQDCIARSETGSGKTLAFVLPLLESILARRKAASQNAFLQSGGSQEQPLSLGSRGAQVAQPQLLVLAPTRELARQVHNEVGALGAPLGISSVCVYGGVPIQQQLREIRALLNPRRQHQQGRPNHEHLVPSEGALDVVVATPGRLMDLAGLGESSGREEHFQSILSLQSIRHVVLDEADEMLKLGFAEAVDTILTAALAIRVSGEGDTPDVSQASASKAGASQLPRQQQLLLFSATRPPWVQKVATKYLRAPLNIDVMHQRTLRTSSTVAHMRMELPFGLSSSSLSSILKDCVLCLSGRDRQSVVFVPTKAEADALGHAEGMGLLSAAVLHGGIEQETREKVMQGFRSGRYRALICTDVAARGIDVANVDLVIQYGVVPDSDQYIHRSGRTGRAGRRGVSLLLHTPNERREAERLEKSCGIRFDRRELPSVEEVLEATSGCVSRELDSVSPSLMPFFLSAAADVLKRAEREGVNLQQVVARALAVAAGVKELPSRSLLTLRAGEKTLELKRLTDWASAREAGDWFTRVMRQSEDQQLNFKFGEPRLHATDKTAAYLDIQEGGLDEVVKAVNIWTQLHPHDTVRISLPTTRPLLEPLRVSTISSPQHRPGGARRNWGGGGGRPPRSFPFERKEGRPRFSQGASYSDYSSDGLRGQRPYKRSR
ncbi:dead deah box ATP-dependent RNA helicase [Cyclospora cayetanensis]|uniref:Dead deah box ATP-dependent RNA helicase n=1 Tax=Cyclospora cayetanensis TaxID=88456 RepID=A0A1D3D6P0_9EIME|nr:dead deah box ATP-dependent RNA helicase [Cyclospora cayetanensis]